MSRYSVFNVPVQRRLQMAALCVANWPTTLIGGLILMTYFLYINTVLRVLMLAYIGYIILIDNSEQLRVGWLLPRRRGSFRVLHRPTPRWQAALR